MKVAWVDRCTAPGRRSGRCRAGVEGGGRGHGREGRPDGPRGLGRVHRWEDSPRERLVSGVYRPVGEEVGRFVGVRAGVMGLGEAGSPPPAAAEVVPARGGQSTQLPVLPGTSQTCTPPRSPPSVSLSERTTSRSPSPSRSATVAEPSSRDRGSPPRGSRCHPRRGARARRRPPRSSTS